MAQFLISESALMYQGSRVFKASTNALFAVLLGLTEEDFTVTGNLNVWKSTDAGHTWAVVETITVQESYEYNFPDWEIPFQVTSSLAWDVDRYNDRLYIASIPAGAEGNPFLGATGARVTVYNMATSSIEDDFTGGPAVRANNGYSANGQKWLFCAYRPGDDAVVILYQSTIRDSTYTSLDPAQTFTAALPDDKLEIGRVYTVACVAGSWGSPVQVWPSPGISAGGEEWQPIGICRGAGGLTHAFGYGYRFVEDLDLPLHSDGFHYERQDYIIAHRSIDADTAPGTATSFIDENNESATVEALFNAPRSTQDGATIYWTYSLIGSYSLVFCASSADVPAWDTQSVTEDTLAAAGLTKAGAFAATGVAEPGGGLYTDMLAYSTRASGCGELTRTTIDVDVPSGLRLAFYSDGGIIYCGNVNNSPVYFWPLETAAACPPKGTIGGNRHRECPEIDSGPCKPGVAFG